MHCFNSKVPSLIANDWNTGFAVKYREELGLGAMDKNH